MAPHFEHIAVGVDADDKNRLITHQHKIKGTGFATAEFGRRAINVAKSHLQEPHSELKKMISGEPLVNEINELADFDGPALGLLKTGGQASV